MLTWSPGWALSNAVARALTAVSVGLFWPAEAVVTTHAVIEAVGELAGELVGEPLAVAEGVVAALLGLLGLLELPLLHAAAVVAVNAAIATAASARLLRMWTLLEQLAVMSK